MQNLKCWGQPVPECTQIAKKVLLFTDTREVPRMEDSFYSDFFYSWALTAGAAIKIVLENNHTLGFTIIHMCTHVHRASPIAASTVHTIIPTRGETTVWKCNFKWEFFSFRNCCLGKCLGNLYFLSLFFSLQWFCKAPQFHYHVYWFYTRELCNNGLFEISCSFHLCMFLITRVSFSWALIKILSSF